MFEAMRIPGMQQLYTQRYCVILLFISALLLSYYIYIFVVAVCTDVILPNTYSWLLNSPCIVSLLLLVIAMLCFADQGRAVIGRRLNDVLQRFMKTRYWSLLTHKPYDHLMLLHHFRSLTVNAKDKPDFLSMICCDIVIINEWYVF